MYKHFFKRFLDIFGSVSVIILLSPLYIFTAIVIYLQDFGPFIFKQDRVGKEGVLFKFYKFRSMPIDTPNVQSSEISKLKITAFGKFIRRTSIDELPQLINILKGDMSLIGPRPPIPTQVNLIKLRTENGAIKCRPGLTGLAQVNSYDFMPEEKKAEWDGIYANSISFVNDTRIVFKTLKYLTSPPPTY